MDEYTSPTLAVLIILAVFAVAAILVFAGVGAASGYVAGRRAPSSTGRSGAMAGLAIGAAVGVSETLLFLFFGVRMNSDGRVRSLFLHNNRLAGVIPDELGGLSNLRIDTINAVFMDSRSGSTGLE